jgi:hypothetical protein
MIARTLIRTVGAAMVAALTTVHAGQIISTNRISEDFEANTVGNNATGWNYALSGSSTGLIQNDGDAHGNYLAMRLVSPGGTDNVFLHWGDTASQPPVPAERWTLDGILTFDFRLVNRPTAFGTFRMMELDANNDVSGPNNSHLMPFAVFGDDGTGDGTFTRVNAFGYSINLQTNFWYSMNAKFYASSNAMTAGDGQPRGTWQLTMYSNSVLLATSSVMSLGHDTFNLPYGFRINQMTIGNWFSSGVGYDIDNILLIAPEPSAAMLLGVGAVLLLRRRGDR